MFNIKISIIYISFYINNVTGLHISYGSWNSWTNLSGLTTVGPAGTFIGLVDSSQYVHFYYIIRPGGYYSGKVMELTNATGSWVENLIVDISNYYNPIAVRGNYDSEGYLHITFWTQLTSSSPSVRSPIYLQNRSGPFIYGPIDLEVEWTSASPVFYNPSTEKGEILYIYYKDPILRRVMFAEAEPASTIPIFKFLDYISNIETLNLTLIEGDGNCIFKPQVSGFGVSGNAQGITFLPVLQADAAGKQQPYAHLEFPIFEILAQNAISGDAEFPLIESNGQMGEPILGNCQFPILDSEGQGRSGNTGEYYFYVQVEGEGNANREYEPC